MLPLPSVWPLCSSVPHEGWSTLGKHVGYMLLMLLMRACWGARLSCAGLHDKVEGNLFSIAAENFPYGRCCSCVITLASIGCIEGSPCAGQMVIRHVHIVGILMHSKFRFSAACANPLTDRNVMVTVNRSCKSLDEQDC